MNELSLASQWHEFKKDNPRVRIRDAATELNTSEMALVATGCGINNTRLKADFREILEGLEKLGSVMALTRSDHAVHELHGEYKNLSDDGSVVIFTCPSSHQSVDAKFYLDKWDMAFAVNENDRHSLQFFDGQGHALHKIYVTDKTNQEEYFALVEMFKSDNQSTDSEAVIPSLAKNDSNENKQHEINHDELYQSWIATSEVDEASRLLNQNLKYRKGEFYKTLGDKVALDLSIQSIEKCLEDASQRALPIKILVLNHAVMQSYSGPVKKLLRTGPWFNVLDPGFNLHLRTEGIGKVWLVKKPAENGSITSIHVLNEAGIEFLLITVDKSRTDAEPSKWQALCDELLKAK